MDEIYSKFVDKNHETNKLNYMHIDEIWSFDLAGTIEYNTSNFIGFR